MSFSLYQILALGAVYLLLLFGIAFSTERGWIPARISQHPLTYVLSLCVFACAWTFYGAIDLAHEYGYGALAYYMGIGGLFIFAPLILSPLFRLLQLYQLGSIADLLAFRFRSKYVGGLTTVCMLLGILPLIALQLQAVTDTINILTYDPHTASSLEQGQHMGILFCLSIAFFTAFFGSSREQHHGLVTALAFESLVKAVALIAVGLFAVNSVFGGLPALQWWLVLHPENQQVLYTPIRNTSNHTLLLLFFSTAITMPHVFHMGFRENSNARTIQMATWGIPLYLLIISLPIYPILWAGFELGSDFAPEYFTIGVPLSANNPKLALFAYLGGLSAATGAMIVITMALASMSLNHLVLPLLQSSTQRHGIYERLVFLRRFLIMGIALLGYGFYYLLDDRQGLTNLAIIAFIETMQFLPGILAVLYWPTANKAGFIAGLLTGTIIWFQGLLVPMISYERILTVPVLDLSIPLGMEHWSDIAMTALAANTLVFLLVSRFSHTSLEEQKAAELCSIDALNRPMRLELDITSADEMKQRLASSLGEDIANNEVNQALQSLELQEDENRPYALRRLRDKVEANLSDLLGAAIAHEIMARLIPYKESDSPSTEDIYYAENRLNEFQHRLTGLAREIDNMRRYHRQILDDLPLAICSFGYDEEILMWNKAMTTLTGIEAANIVGSRLQALPEPWLGLISNFFHGDREHSHKTQIKLNGRSHWISLHKAQISSTLTGMGDGQVILLEDLTETQRLEEELIHSERLASIGRLAAGVAHEIGNPVTGIACLAQNLEFDAEHNETLETARQILGQTERISRIVNSLVSFSHSGTPDQEMAQTDLYECIIEAISLLHLQKNKKQIRYVNEVEKGQIIFGNNQRLTQVFINLLSNARDASDQEGHIWIKSERTNDQLLIRVIDEGSGIPREYQDQLFEPFFTTKQAGEGTGLGLAMVYSILEEHKASIRVNSPCFENGRGTAFTLQFPLDKATQDEHRAVEG